MTDKVHKVPIRLILVCGSGIKARFSTSEQATVGPEHSRSALRQLYKSGDTASGGLQVTSVRVSDNPDGNTI